MSRTTLTGSGTSAASTPPSVIVTTADESRTADLMSNIVTTLHPTA